MAKMGRKKTLMKMIQRADARQVSFSKRRSGIFKKASELCTLCAAEIAVIIFSPGGKAFSFGHPSVNAVMNNLSSAGNPDGDAPAAQDSQADQDSNDLHELNKIYSDLQTELQKSKERGEELKRELQKEQADLWWFDKPIDDLSLNKMMVVKAALEELKEKVDRRKQEILEETMAEEATGFPAAGHSVALDLAGNKHGGDPF